MKLTDEEILKACDSTKWIAPEELALDIGRAIEAAVLAQGEQVAGLKRCEFDDECEFCKDPQGGTWAKLTHNAEDCTEIEFYICGCCINKAIKQLKSTHPAPVAKQEPSGWLDEQTGDYSRVNRLGWSALYLHPAPSVNAQERPSLLPPDNDPMVLRMAERISELEAQNAKTLTNEQIDELWRKSCSLEGFSTAQFVRHFARAAIAAAEGKV